MFRRSCALVPTVTVLAIGAMVGVASAQDEDQQGPTFVETTDPLVLKAETPATLHVASTAASLQLVVIPADLATATCDGGAAPPCTPTGGLVEIQVELIDDTAARRGTLVAMDLRTGRRVTRQLQVATGTAEPTQPSKLTVTVTGCEALYRTALLGCPADSFNDEIGDGLDIAQGTAIVAGDGGATGEITLQQCPLTSSSTGATTTTSLPGDSPCQRTCRQAGADSDDASLDTSPTATGGTAPGDTTSPAPTTSSPRAATDGVDEASHCTIMRVSEFATFGTFEGTLGTGDSAVTLSVKRRAPVVVGYFVLLVGAALAGIVSWLNQLAAFSVTRRKYRDALTRLQERRDQVKARVTPGPTNLEAWNIEPLLPEPLSARKQRIGTEVTGWITLADATIAGWTRRLVPLLDLSDTIKNAGGTGAALAAPVDELLHLPAAPYSASQLMMLRNLTIQLEAGDPTLKARLLACPTLAAAMTALGQPWSEDGDEAEGAVVGAEPTTPSVWIPAIWSFVAVLAVVTIVSMTFDERYGHGANLPIALGLGTVLGAGAIAIAVGVVRRGWSVLVAGLVGWLLAALLGGSDAVNPSSAWGTPADVLKALGAAFAVGGVAQLLRFGYPGDKVTAT